MRAKDAIGEEKTVERKPKGVFGAKNGRNTIAALLDQRCLRPTESFSDADRPAFFEPCAIWLRRVAPSRSTDDQALGESLAVTWEVNLTPFLCNQMGSACIYVFEAPHCRGAMGAIDGQGQ